MKILYLHFTILWMLHATPFLQTSNARENQESVNPTVSFINDVIPVFSKTGCNAGSCHGSANGQDGFHLSLFGYDPKSDHQALVYELPGRRINLALPAESLLLKKATGQVPHTGGKLFEEESKHYKVLLDWITQQATYDAVTAKNLTEIEITPASKVLVGHQSSQPLSVIATYDDGSKRDVTGLTWYSSNNPVAANVSNGGVVVAKQPGEAFVMARFGAFTVGSSFIVHDADTEFRWTAPEPQNFIDIAIDNKLKNLRILPSDTCTDAEFMRRVSIDLNGRFPDPASLEAFIADDDPEKRAKLIDRLLESPEFKSLWVMKWAERFHVRSDNRFSDKATWKFYNWLKDQIENEVPPGQWLREMLVATGSNFDNPPASFYNVLPDRNKLAEDVAQVFLGMRIQCAQCHNHPFDRWTMDDYYGFSAFFEKTRIKFGTDRRERIVLNGGGRTVQPATGEQMKPKFLGGVEPALKGRDRREVLADWLLAPENPYFARNLANFVWEHFFGRGIVHEVDDVRVSNPPVNEQLLRALADRLVDSDYDVTALARDICNSRTYQASTIPNATNPRDKTNFSKANLRRIRAEVLLDIISQVTETENRINGLPTGASAMEIADGKTSNYFLTTFGRSTRQSVCTCEVSMEPNLSQALHLINGDTVGQKIVQGDVVGKLLKAGKTNEEIIDELYLRCFARHPNAAERQSLQAESADIKQRKAFLQDVFWALLNSREFLFNH